MRKLLLALALLTVAPFAHAQLSAYSGIGVAIGQGSAGGGIALIPIQYGPVRICTFPA